MYVHLELKTVSPNLSTQAIERLSRLHSLMSKADGFLSAQMWADVSDLSKYMVTRAWRDAEAHARYRASDAAKDFAANRPPTPLWENTAVQEWLSTVAVQSLGTGQFLARALTDASSPGFPTPPHAQFRDMAQTSGADSLMWLWRLSQRSELDQLGLGRRAGLCGYELITEIGLKD
jgi:heme-degrading monooxygenase HmoA